MKEKKNDLALFKPRNSGAATNDGFRLYMSCFRQLLRSSWLSAVLYALATCLMSKLAMSIVPVIVISQHMHYNLEEALLAQGPLPVLFVLSALLYFITSTLLSAHAFTAMAEHQQGGSVQQPVRWYGHLSMPILGRTCIAATFVLVLTMAASALTVLVLLAVFNWLGTVAAVIFFVVLAGLLLLLFIPLPYCLLKYLLTPKASLLPTIAKQFGTALRHWGAFFVVTIIVSIVYYVLAYITELPAFILIVANMSSQAGMLQGDPSGMPEYMGWLTSLVFCLAGFIQAYIMLSTLFPYYYLYGSVEAQEKDLKEISKTL